MDFMEYLQSIFGDIFGDIGGTDRRRGTGNYYDAPDNRMRSGGDGPRGGERMTPPGFNPNMAISRPNDGGFGGISRPNDGPQMRLPVTDGPRVGGRPMVPPGLGFNPPNRPQNPIGHANRPGRVWFDEAPPAMDRGSGPGRTFDGPQWGGPTAAEIERKMAAIAKGGSPGTRYDPRKMDAPMPNNPFGGPSANRTIKR
jgi:hypothetical protein